MNERQENKLKILRQTLKWSKERNYKGYSKFDALNSNLLYDLSKNSKFLRRAFSYTFSRSPINLRPLFNVKKKYNCKGLALFARSYFNLFKLYKNQSDLDEALKLIYLILKYSQKQNFSGHCWGYDHPWENGVFFAPSNYPNAIVTLAVCEALLDGYEITNNVLFLDIVLDSIKFFMNDLTTIISNDDEFCISYVPNSDLMVINVNALTASLFSRIYNLTGDIKIKTDATRLLNWVVNSRTDEYSWYYTVPSNKSRIRVDNYHTGFVLISLLSYEKYISNSRFLEVLENGLLFYKNKLFLPDGQPKWMSDELYPADIHGSSQGVITFSQIRKNKLIDSSLSNKIYSWTTDNLYSKEERFYYQKYEKLIKKYTLMRWCNAWMCFAISDNLLNENRVGIDG